MTKQTENMANNSDNRGEAGAMAIDRTMAVSRNDGYRRRVSQYRVFSHIGETSIGSLFPPKLLFYPRYNIAIYLCMMIEDTNRGGVNRFGMRNL